MHKTWNQFITAPHRVMFFGGAVQIILSMAWWLFDLSTRYFLPAQALVWPLPPPVIHAWLMLFGLFPYFFFGFLMTTFPRWMAGHEIPASGYVPAFLFMFAGVLLFYSGLLFGQTLLAAASASLLIGWGCGLNALLHVLLGTRPGDKRHPLILFIAFCIGWLALSAFLLWQMTDIHGWLQFALRAGLWGFVLPVFATVAHRMFPFFTASALKLKEVPHPFWALWIMLAASLAHGTLEFFGWAAWLWVADLPLALAAFTLSHLWGLRRSFANPLLAVLHTGFLWLGIAMVLYATQSFWLMQHDTPILGNAPLHALTIGCYATLIMGMGTRVTLGHSGLPFIIDTPVKLMFAGIQLAALLRVLADLLAWPAMTWLQVAAGLVWLTSFIPWVWRYLPAYWRPRTDGMQG